MTSDSRREAQVRADQIRAFRRELRTVQAADLIRLSGEEEAALAAYHDRVLDALAADYDVDRSSREGQLSRGLRLASLFGAAALVASITTLVYRVWGGLGLPAQITLLTAFPLASLAGVQFAAERERTRYVAGLFALVACGTAWFAIAWLPRLLDLPPSALLLWPAAGFGIAVAVSYGFRLVFGLSLAILAIALASVFFVAGGVPWPQLFGRLEPLAGAAFALTVMARHLTPIGPGFEAAARQTGQLLGLGALLVLSNAQGSSLLSFSPPTAMAIYQVLFVLVAIALLWRGLRREDERGVAITAIALGLFLLVRYVDWFWDRLPAWAFFLVLAGIAFGSIAALRRLRHREHTLEAEPS